MRAEIFRALNASVVKDGQPILTGLNMELCHGETVGVFGTFDSGKTSLLDMITGKIELQSGVLYFNETPYNLGGINYPGARIVQISKTSSLLNGLKLWENILVIRKHRLKKIFLSKNLIIKEMAKCFAEYKLDFDPNQLTDTLTPIQHIIMEILKAYLLNVQLILISDFSIECSQKEYDELFLFMDKLKKNGISFIVTSYRISNLKMCADKILFLAGGSIVKAVENRAKESKGQIDRIITSIFPENFVLKNNKVMHKEIVFQAKDIDVGLESPISFDLRKGEIVAFVDPFIASNNILANKLRTCDKTSTFLLHGKPVRKFGWNEKAIFVDFNTDDLIFTRLPILNNICFTSYIKYSFMGIIRRRLCKFVSEEFIQWYGDDSLNNVPNSTNLSKKQRVAILLFRLRLANPEVLFCLDPGIGSDYINNAMIHKELADFAYQKGMAICIFVSSTDNMQNLADRYIIISNEKLLEDAAYENINSLVYSSSND